VRAFPKQYRRNRAKKDLDIFAKRLISNVLHVQLDPSGVLFDFASPIYLPVTRHSRLR
jgi:hypothetical protein